VTIDPFHVRKLSDWSDADFDLDDLVLPEQPQWQRCGAVHCIDDGHSMSLGDVGAPDYWRETWL